MDNYKNVSYDNGGVHINSGIPNHAFYVAAMELGGHAWEKAGRIWYITLRDKLQSNSDFEDAARETVSVAGELYGEDSPEQTAVRNGWAAVGLRVGEDDDDDDGDGGDGGEEPQGCLQSVAGLLGMRLVRDK
jgi:Zn-dependent metalloprotease